MTVGEIKKELESINGWMVVNNHLDFNTRNDIVHGMLVELLSKIK